ncbi:lysophospholipid acyltransferase family protein [Acetobacteraceae bacterium H6797]|nr:lysophospholipid acyltransferase family protein [Acetobacteraceae bacterium H6797]
MRALSRWFKAVSRSGFLAQMLGVYLTLCDRTARWAILGGENLEPLLARREGFIIAFWHECLPLMPMAWTALWQRAPQGAIRRPARVLVSRSRDGQMIGRLLGRFGLSTIDGSSSNGARAAARTLIGAIRSGSVVVVVPDGPRGPRRGSADGACRIASFTGAPVVPCAAHARQSFRLGSWDKMVIPLPFARCIAVVGTPFCNIEGEDGEGRLRQALTAVADEAVAKTLGLAGLEPATKPL